jgi:hypothetical protein
VGGPCNDTPLELAPGGAKEQIWYGSFLVRTRKGARECDVRKQAVAAWDRVTVAVYATAEDARLAPAPFKTVQTEFELGVADVVEVPINP